MESDVLNLDPRKTEAGSEFQRAKGWLRYS